MIHSVTLDKQKCMGCTTCIKRCPTEAIRVRRGKATIISELCIDCGECIRACPHHAKKAVCDPWERLGEFRWTVALPAPSLYGQFHNLDDAGIVLGGLLELGFNEVYEVARAAEMISDHSRQMRQDKPEGLKLPLISSACPACVRLILQRFPKLVSHIDPHVAPVDLAALCARAEAVERTGLTPEEIGVFFITPCPAKMTATHNPLGLTQPVADGALSMTDVYLRLLPAMKRAAQSPPALTSGLMGIGWAVSGGEGKALLNSRYISVDGIPNVINVLEDIEDGKLSDIDFVEVGACTQGCLGGCLTVENPFVAKTRIRALQKYMPVSRNPWKSDEKSIVQAVTLEPQTVLQLDTDMNSAMDKYRRIHELAGRLPGLDCSSCGAPSCRALAEDVVCGYASESDCIFQMRSQMQHEADSSSEALLNERYLPPPFRTKIE